MGAGSDDLTAAADEGAANNMPVSSNVSRAAAWRSACVSPGASTQDELLVRKNKAHTIQIIV